MTALSRMTSTKTVLVVVLLSCSALMARADEWRGTAERLLNRGLVNGLSPVRAEQSVVGFELVRGRLFEDDGPAAGYSYRPNEERLDGKTIIRKQLLVDDPRTAQAFLLVAPGGKLEAVINEQPTELTPRGKAGNYWEQYEISPSLLKAGLNSIVLKGQGKVWIARDDERPTISPPPHRSVKSGDQGGTWSDKLGPKGDIDGEYYVRLYLEQHQPIGTLTLPVLDLLNLNEAPIAPELSKSDANALSPVTLRITGMKSVTQSISLQVRTGRSWVPNREWSDWQAVEWSETKPLSGTSITCSATLPKPRGRFLEARLQLTSDDKNSSPQLHSIVVSTDERPKQSDWWRSLQPRIEPEHSIVRSPIPFAHEQPDHPVLKRLREEHQLDRLVESASNDLDRLKRLAAWSSQQWQKGHLGETYPAWNAFEILKPHRDGTPIGGFCQQYNVLFLQACQSLGYVGRAVSIGPGEFGSRIRSGHEVVEIWSDQFRKWIYIDGDACWYLVEEKSGTPLSLRELRERQLQALREQPHEPVAVVPIPLDSGKPRYEWKGLTSFPAFAELRLIPRSNVLSQPEPLPLNQGMRGWFWPGHVVWTDDLSPAARLYGQRVSTPSNWDWTVNQVEARLFATERDRELFIALDHNAADFDHYMIRTDSSTAAPIIEKQSSFLWKLHPGINRLTIQVVNRLGRLGSPTTVTIE